MRAKLHPLSEGATLRPIKKERYYTAIATAPLLQLIAVVIFMLVQCSLLRLKP